MMLAVWFAAYLAVHFGLYALVIRHARLTASEKGIFLYHLIPALAWVVGLTVLSFGVPAIDAAHVFLVAGLHGIYSLTFLELWALADGGYSLAILERLESGAGRNAALGDMEQLGAVKNASRLAHLVRMGMVEERAGAFRLTTAGRAAAGFVAFIVWLADVPMSD